MKNYRRMKAYFPVILLSVLRIRQAGCFSTGAPENEARACNDMTPGHGVDPQVTSPPMRLVTEGTEAVQGQLVRIRLQSSTNDYVRGFIIQARDATRTDRRVGTFVFAGGVNSKFFHGKSQY